MNTRDVPQPTRRALLGGALAAAIVGVASVGAEAQVKAPQKAVEYQEKPKGNQECDNCLQFQPPNACKLVDGKINPKGWCKLYAPKPK
ncbi:MAG TPA: high-potential iron-sulfur protein [Methylomirabilota bacterium]|nr:high-potential iron-sulfur protein [Methylomirabilota bacterium]